MTPVYDLSLPGERERLQAVFIRREPRERRFLVAMALASKEARQQYLYKVRAKHGEDAAQQLIADLRAYKRGRE